ncbi:MAG: hypothetical protein V3V72_13500 [Ignavibacteriaceae bacterium]
MDTIIQNKELSGIAKPVPGIGLLLNGEYEIQINYKDFQYGI